MAVSLASLIVSQTKAQIYEFALGIATALGLPVSTWTAGDPSRSLLHVEAELHENLEAIRVGYTQSAFLDHATGEWLTVLADQVFGVTVAEATYATCDVVITNPGGGYYPGLVAGDLTFRNSTTGVTYTSTSGGTLESGPATTLTVSVRADVAGSDGSAAATEIDEMVTPLGSSTCSNALAAVGVDAPDEATIRALCRARLGRLTPNGSKDAYTDVALDSDLTETTNITRARAYSDADTGDVTVYLAGPSGAIAEADRALVELAILENCTPLCITPTVSSVSNVSVNVTYAIRIYKRCGKTEAEIEADIETALEEAFADRPIGGDILEGAATGYLYQSLISSVIRETFSADAFSVTVSAPAADVALTNGQVAALGTVTPTVTIIPDPT